jgi:hypothetical protein
MKTSSFFLRVKKLHHIWAFSTSNESGDKNTAWAHYLITEQ